MCVTRRTSPFLPPVTKTKRIGETIVRSLREYLQFCVCIQQQIHTDQPPHALTTSTPQLAFFSAHTHTDRCSQRSATAQRAQNEASSAMTDPRILRSPPRRGKATAQPGSAACYTHQPLSKPPKDSDTIPPSHQPRAPPKGGGLPISLSVAQTCKIWQLLTTESTFFFFFKVLKT